MTLSYIGYAVFEFEWTWMTRECSTRARGGKFLVVTDPPPDSFPEQLHIDFKVVISDTNIR